MNRSKKISISDSYRRILSNNDNNPPAGVRPSFSSTASTALVFLSVVLSLILLCGYCRFARRRSIADARRRLVRQLRERIPEILATRPVAASLPAAKYSRSAIEGVDKVPEDCPVCLEVFEEGEEVKVVVPGCGHLFHPQCIDRWLAMRDTCPVCRSTVVFVEGSATSAAAGGSGGGQSGEGRGGGEVGVSLERLVVAIEEIRERERETQREREREGG